GSRTFTRNQKRINDALKAVRDAKGHADDHDQRCSNHHARNRSGPSRIWSELMSEKLREPAQSGLRAAHALRLRGHAQCPRIRTTADSPTRNNSAGGFATRTRTGYRAARCTQFSVLCTSGRPGSKRPNTSGSGVTPNPMLSTTPENLRSGRARTYTSARIP